MTGRKRGLIAGVACAAVALGAIIATTDRAVAAQPGSGGMVLRAENAQQRGTLDYYEWTRGNEDGCVGQVADGLGGFPAARATEPGPQDLRLRLRWHQQPDEVEVTAWSQANNQGNPAGEPMGLPVVLEPRTRGDGAQVWDAVVSADVGEDLFLAAVVSWPDHPVCDGSRTLDKHFHLTSGD